MKDNFEELDQRFLEITRDLTNSLGHELLTDELIVVKEHLFQPNSSVSPNCRFSH